MFDSEKLLDAFKDKISLRNLTPNTIKSYCTYIRAYLDFLLAIEINPEDASYDVMRNFIDCIQKNRNLKDRTVNCVIAQLRFFTLYLLGKPWDKYQIPVRKFDTYLPYVPSQQDVKIFLESIPDLKFKAMATLMYSSGLRVSEVCHIKCEDICRKDMRIHIRHSKNRSDRYAQLSHYALHTIEEYWYCCENPKPREWLFPMNRLFHKPMHTQWVSTQILNHEKRLGWKHRITCHTFRHALGTHLYDQGVDLLTIKAILGHKSIESTLIYVHLSSAKLASVANPLDVVMGVHHE